MIIIFARWVNLNPKVPFLWFGGGGGGCLPFLPWQNALFLNRGRVSLPLDISLCIHDCSFSDHSHLVTDSNITPFLDHFPPTNIHHSFFLIYFQVPSTKKTKEPFHQPLNFLLWRDFSKPLIKLNSILMLSIRFSFSFRYGSILMLSTRFSY